MSIRMNSDYQKKLLKKWGPMLESGEKIADVQQKLVMAQVLENTRNFFVKKGLFTEKSAVGPLVPNANPVSGIASVTTPSPTDNPVQSVAKLDNRADQYSAVMQNGVMTPNDVILPNVVMPMLRRIFPTLMAHELVSVQPLTGPVGYALALRARTMNKGAEGGLHQMNGKTYEVGFDIDPTYTGVGSSEMDYAAGGEQSFESWVSGGTEYPSVNPQAYGRGEFTGPAQDWSFAAAGGNPKYYPRATFELQHKMVEAQTRKLGSEWYPELAEDLEAMHGIDIETEMVNMISFEIGAEIDQQIKNAMLKAAWEDSVEWSPALADGLDQMGRLATLFTLVSKRANDIALKTRRGAGNFVVASTTVTSLLESFGTKNLVSDGKSMPSVPASSIGALSKEGLINDGRQLLVRDTYTPVDYALVGYKGTQTGDSGIIYCPYIPVQLVKTMDPNTFAPRIGARTRYGLLDNPFDAENYYSLVKISGLDAATTYTFCKDGRNFFGIAASGSSSAE